MRKVRLGVIQIKVFLKKLLLKCLEHHYGSIDSCISFTKDEGAIAIGKLNSIENILRG